MRVDPQALTSQSTPKGDNVLHKALHIPIQALVGALFHSVSHKGLLVLRGQLGR